MGPCSSSSKNKQASPMLDKKANQIPSSQANPIESQQPNNIPERNPHVSQPQAINSNEKAKLQSDEGSESIEEKCDNTKNRPNKPKAKKLGLE